MLAVERSLNVAHCEADRFVITVRGHQIEVDQPVEDGGSDLAATPTELFVASLAGCVAYYARRYLARHALPEEGLAVRAAYTIVPRPARVGEISLEIELPTGVPADRHAALLAVASHCTVHNSLESPPAVKIELAANT